MRIVIAVLGAVILALQVQYWFGRGGRADLAELRRQVAVQRGEIEQLQLRNSALAAEVQDLQQGFDAIEELARSEIGMIRDDEVFYQVIDRVPAAAGTEPATND